MRVEEVSAMRVARKAGLPVPYFIRYGDHENTPWTPTSMLMIGMPGEPLLEEL